MHKKVDTIQHLTTELGLSRYVVSSVLNGKEKERRVAASTAKRIRDYIKEVDFHQNISALSMRGKYSKDVLIILHPMLYLEQRRIYFRLLEYLNANELSYSTLFFHPQNLGIFYSEFEHFNPKKVIVFSYFLSCDENFPIWESFCQKSMLNRECFYHDFPIKNKNRSNILKNASATWIDRDRTFKLDIKRLIDEGYKEIFVSNVNSNILSENKQIKFIQYKLDIQNLSHENNFYENGLIEIGRELGEFVIEKGFKAGESAIIIYDDYVAMGLVNYLESKLISVPQDIKIIAKGGFIETHYFRINIDSWSYPFQKMYDEIINWIEGRSEHGQTIEFRDSLEKISNKN